MRFRVQGFGIVGSKRLGIGGFRGEERRVWIRGLGSRIQEVFWDGLGLGNGRRARVLVEDMGF